MPADRAAAPPFASALRPSRSPCAGLALDRYADLGAPAAARPLHVGLPGDRLRATSRRWSGPRPRWSSSWRPARRSSARSSGASTSTGSATCRCSCPPGHGLVYLTGLRLSQTAVGAPARPRLLVRLGDGRAWAAGRCSAWSALGRGTSPARSGRRSSSLFLWRGRAPAVYAGVFFAVAFLEIYGTAVGTWTVGRGGPRPRRPRRQPAERGGQRLRLLRHRGPGARAGPARLASLARQAAGPRWARHASRGPPAHPASVISVGHSGRAPGVLRRRRDDGLPRGNRHLPADVGEVEHQVVEQVGGTHQHVARRGPGGGLGHGGRLSPVASSPSPARSACSGRTSTRTRATCCCMSLDTDEPLRINTFEIPARSPSA